MSVRLGNTEINKLYLGDMEISKMYLGSVELFDGLSSSNLYPYSNAIGDDTDSYDQWNWTSSISVASVASTDSVLGDNFAIRLEARNDGLTSSSLNHEITGLTDGVKYKATIRCRASITGGNTSDVFFNWSNVTNVTYNGSVIGTDWEEVEVIFTPTDPTSFTLKAYPFYNSGGSSLTGDFLEISSIIIEEIIAPELFTGNAASDQAGEVNGTDGWTAVGSCSVNSVSTDPQTGNYHIEIESTGSGGHGVRGQFEIPIENGEQYRIIINAREEVSSDCRMQIFGGVSGWSTVALTDVWTEYDQTVTATSNNLIMRFYPDNGNGSTGDKIFLDNISVKKIS